MSPRRHRYAATGKDVDVPQLATWQRGDAQRDEIGYTDGMQEWRLRRIALAFELSQRELRADSPRQLVSADSLQETVVRPPGATAPRLSWSSDANINRADTLRVRVAL